ncbi:hypothetical protein EP12_07975 [Alteromonas australica]|uniref:hypothetical protein n=1 Tax=Alteromonas australica TaxID=589873 RepID=UPI0005C4297F|nr:hypothetical protein [Alteromonas australica]AJP43618.1 hypothetical protein EP12_07975 [Alteromonas australica]MAF69745.1 hypothetical protein [Alteromonas sp.]|tara:strand:+ start:2009 stop:2275 length:267 start_codon:yes stop_codon:yes gene_type:complete
MNSEMEKRALDVEDKRTAAIDKAEAILSLVQLGVEEHGVNQETVSRALWAAGDLLFEAREAQTDFQQELAERNVRIVHQQIEDTLGKV